ncbi:hypothetical protein GQ55_2G435600 [Panicum hallii var. hallii]|uniref:Uncharacterized protein n=1 Tax=Panicum hallii var. hallii TaxID=1504633 RepID=A0A2T7EYN6_9POAL|nr:hypothetical protein GQ55_2G435600 [Panicum hallii var. hallii]
MEVMVPVMAPSAPCSPRTAAIAGGDHLPGYCYFFSSAPTSPSRASYAGDASPGAAGDEATFDFTLGFSGQLQEATPILADADDLFEGGRIRPLNTPHPSILLVDDTSSSSNYSSCTGPRSPRRAGARGGDQAEALERGRSGRPAAPTSAASSRSRRATRSLSPFRGGGGGGIEDDEFPSSPPSPRSSMMRGCGSGSKKWRLKDLFLFRSASEGRATGGGSKDPLFKYTMLSSSTSFSHPQKLKSGDGSASMRKGRGSTASASDMPYTTNRAAAEDMRRRTTTPLPFHRNSLFGYLRSNPAIHSISRKLGNHSSSNRGRPT